mmetsp:Transcript_12272/g.29763  ORF Transcript_12272/g.29763 Transcript_12272/m.29763 type:complete len:254 (-) Transcript_12272:77-838(-)
MDSHGTDFSIRMLRSPRSRNRKQTISLSRVGFSEALRFSPFLETILRFSPIRSDSSHRLVPEAVDGFSLPFERVNHVPWFHGRPLAMVHVRHCVCQHLLQKRKHRFTRLLVDFEGDPFAAAPTRHAANGGPGQVLHDVRGFRFLVRLQLVGSLAQALLSAGPEKHRPRVTHVQLHFLVLVHEVVHLVEQQGLLLRFAHVFAHVRAESLRVAERRISLRGAGERQLLRLVALVPLHLGTRKSIHCRSYDSYFSL